MTKLEIKGDWNIAKGKLKQKWAKLTRARTVESLTGMPSFLAALVKAPW